jgi:hypothetical protein
MILAKPVTNFIATMSLMAWLASAVRAADDRFSSAGASRGTNSNLPHHERFDACRKEADERKLTPDTGRREFIRNCLRSERSDIAAAKIPTTSAQ